MKLYLHLVVIITILSLLYGLYGAWKTDVASRNFYGFKRYLPFLFLILPKTVEKFTTFYRVALISTLLFVAALYILTLLS